METVAMQAIIVDDSKAMRAILRNMMEDLGFAVWEAGGGAEALDLLRHQGRPDVALVDWNMPGMSGVDLIRQMRADPLLEGLRILMVTTEVEAARVAVALQAGAQEYLMKPFTAETLQEKLSLLGLRKG